jgi:hypothetical protein
MAAGSFYVERLLCDAQIYLEKNTDVNTFADWQEGKIFFAIFLIGSKINTFNSFRSKKGLSLVIFVPEVRRCPLLSSQLKKFSLVMPIRI